MGKNGALTAPDTVNTTLKCAADPSGAMLPVSDTTRRRGQLISGSRCAVVRKMRAAPVPMTIGSGEDSDRSIARGLPSHGDGG